MAKLKLNLTYEKPSLLNVPVKFNGKYRRKTHG